jgi:hypothetical protein
MNTSSEATRLLQEALTKTREAAKVIDNLIVEHEYQDVAALVAQAAVALLDSATLLLASQDQPALDAIEKCDDLLDQVYSIIDGETDDE